MAAGYTWDWISKKDSSAYDIEIEGIRKRWNNASGGNWVNSPNAVHEVGSIHTVQGYDLNYGFIIIGNDLKYDATWTGLLSIGRHSKTAVQRKPLLMKCWNLS